MDVLGDQSRCAVDATGLESRYISRYYVWRRGQKRHRRVCFPKLTVAWDIATHFALSGHVCLGPTNDTPQFRPVIVEAAARQRIVAVLADKGYDAESSHVLCREQLAIESTIIPLRRPPWSSRVWPTTRYRRQMKCRENRDGYGQRWQAESGFSMHKRVLGASLRARDWTMQCAEILLRLLTHNLMLIADAAISQ